MRDLGVDSDELALRVSFAPKWMRSCADIRQDHPMPTVLKHKIVRSIPENEDFVLTGVGGSGKSWEMRKFASKLKEKGKNIHYFIPEFSSGQEQWNDLPPIL